MSVLKQIINSFIFVTLLSQQILWAEDSPQPINQIHSISQPIQAVFPVSQTTSQSSSSIQTEVISAQSTQTHSPTTIEFLAGDSAISITEPSLDPDANPNIESADFPGTDTGNLKDVNVPIPDSIDIESLDLNPQVTGPIYQPIDSSLLNQSPYEFGKLVHVDLENELPEMNPPVLYVSGEESSYPGLGGVYLQATFTVTPASSNEAAVDVSIPENSAGSETTSAHITEAEAREAIEDHVQKVFEDRSMPQIELRLIARDGGSYYVDLTIGIENPSHYVGIVTQGAGDEPTVYLRKTDLEIEAVVAILKELQIPMEQLDKIVFTQREQVSCEVPGCMLQSGDLQIRTKVEQTYRYFEGQITKYYSVENQEPYDVSLTEVDTPKIRYMKTLLQNDLHNTFGLGPVQVEQYLRDGLIRFEVDALANTAKVILDSRVRGLFVPNGIPYLANLLGSYELPLEIHYQLEYPSLGNTMMMWTTDAISGEGSPPSHFPGIATAEFRLSDGRIVSLDYLRYRYPLIPDQPVMPSSRTIGNSQITMPIVEETILEPISNFLRRPSGRVNVVRIFREESACSEANPNCGVLTRRRLERIRYEYSVRDGENFIKALVEYFDESQGNVAFRKVEISSKNAEDGEYRIRLITDLHAHGNVIRTSEFHYHIFGPIYVLAPCHITGGCPPQPRVFKLANIERKDQAGNVLALILGFFHREDGIHATIQLANEANHEVIFQSWEDLLNQATTSEVFPHMIIDNPLWPPPDVTLPPEPSTEWLTIELPVRESSYPGFGGFYLQRSVTSTPVPSNEAAVEYVVPADPGTATAPPEFAPPIESTDQTNSFTGGAVVATVAPMASESSEEPAQLSESESQAYEPDSSVASPPLPPLAPVPIEPGSFLLNQPLSERVVVQSPVILEKPEIGTESEEPVSIPIDLGRELQTLTPVGNAIEQQNDFKFSGNAGGAGSSSAVDVFSPGATFEATFSVAPHKQPESSSEVSVAVTQVNPIPAPPANDVDAFLVAAQTIGFQSFLRGAVNFQSPNSASSPVVFGSSNSRKADTKLDKDEKVKKGSRFQSQFSDLILKPVSKSKKQS